MAALPDSLAPELRDLVREAPAPERSAAMRAVLTDERFSDPGWVFERKLDGIRCVAIRDGGPVRLLSRNDLSMNDRFPEIAAALAGEPRSRFAIDGEVVAFEGSQTSFARLAQRRQRPTKVWLYAFDIVWLDGWDVRGLPLLERKRLLRDALTPPDGVRIAQYRRERGAELFQEACRRGWEGLIAKRVDSVYTDSRSRDWLKFKCGQGQELVVGGFTEPKGSRTDLGALLVGYYDDDGLHYAGKVGTGFDRATLGDLAARLAPLRRAGSPFAEEVRGRGITWVEPELVAQIGFSEWTRDGRLRHPRFLGLREDKPARKVVREG
jgi:DNA ligase D-like protein (predicted ligase)